MTNVMKWIRVDSGERPEPETDVIVMSDDEVSVAAYDCGSRWEQWYDYIRDSEFVEVTHWAHLPEPPSKEVTSDETESKLSEIWEVIAMAKHLCDIRPRTWSNLIHDIAVIIDPSYSQINNRMYRNDEPPEREE